MARGSLPAQTPIVPSHSFVAFDFLYQYVQRLSADLTATTASAAPAGATTQVQYNNVGALGASANFVYNSGTNTVSFGHLTGSALGLTIQPKTPTVLESPGSILLLGRAPSKANTQGGGISLTAGNATGTGTGGAVTISSGGSPAFIGGDIVVTCEFGPIQGGSFIATSGVSGVASGALFSMEGGLSGTTGGSFSMGAGNGGGVGESGGTFLLYLGGGITNDGSMLFQDSLGNNFLRLTTASPGGAMQIGLFNKAPAALPTVAIVGATRVAGGGATVTATDTFDGYTIAQMAAILRKFITT